MGMLRVPPASVEHTDLAGVRAFLALYGYTRDQAGEVIAEAARFPGNYAYTADRGAWVVRHMPAGHYNAGDNRAGEARTAALRTRRRGQYR